MMEKRKFTIISDWFKVLKFSVSMVWKLRKTYLLLRILIAFLNAGEIFWEILILRMLINDIVLEKGMEIIVADAILLCVGILVIKSLNVIFNWMASTGYVKLCDNFSINSLSKKMRLKYSLLEDPDTLDKMSNLWRTDGVVSNSIEQLCVFISGVTIFVGSISILSSLNIFLVILFVFITVFNSYFTRKEIREINSIDVEKAPIDRRLNYYMNKTLNVDDGKEVRIFNLKDYYINKIKKTNQDIFYYENKKEKQNFLINILTSTMNNIQMFLLYLYSAFKYLNGDIIIADFFMYIATISKLSSSFETMITAFQKTAAQKEQLDRLENYMALPEEMYIGKSGNIDSKFILEFKNVSFNYPNTDRNVLNDVNIVMSLNEKISVVGKNGAGKSTFIKLICRLYEPTQGEILLNGKNIFEYDYKDYVNTIGIVFQDFRLIPFTIRDNLQLDKSVKEEKLLMCLEKADIRTRIEKLEKGIDTYIGKGTGYNGVDMSGGEKQKIAIGRMYAKDSTLLILDEATAAIDPLAEDIIFNNMNNIMGNHLVVFISHRMSNARFSDKIIFIDNNKVEEYGKHDDLISNDGEYAKLYKMQEQYYKD